MTGVVAGVVHVLTGPDHLAAVSPLVANQRGGAWAIGLRWGVGHTYGVWLVALLMFVLKEAVPIDRLSGWSETLVGVMLIVIGLWGLQKALRQRIHHHEHVHDGVRHTHFHMHDQIDKQHDQLSHKHSHAAMGVGLLHGLASGRHLVAVLPALAMPGPASTLLYLLGYGVGSIGAMSGFSWALGKLIQRWMDSYARAYSLALGGFAVIAIGLGIVWLSHAPLTFLSRL
jgi:ABC-type nickel/cobalt efflux system permease component RcnA